MKMLKRLLRSSVGKYGLASLFPRLLSILAVLVITPLAREKLGLAGYGYWVLATQVPSIIVSPDLGLTFGLVNRLVRVHQQSGTLRGERRQLVELSRLLWMVAIVWFFLGLIGASSYLRLSRGIADETTLFTGMIVALAIFTAGIPAMVTARAQLAQEVGHESVLWEGYGKAAAMVASLGILWLAPSVILLVVAYMLPTTLAAWLNVRSYSRREFEGLGAVSWSSPVQAFRNNSDVFRAGKYFVLIQLSYLLGTSLDPYVIGMLGTSIDVAYVSVLKRPFDVLPLVVTLFSTSLWPVFTRLHYGRNYARLRQLVYGASLGGGALAFLGGVALIVLSEPVFEYLGAGQVNVSTADMVWVTIQVSAFVTVVVASNLLKAFDRIRAQAWIQIVAGILSLVVKACAFALHGTSGYFAAGGISYLVLTVVPIWLLASIAMRDLSSKGRIG